VSHGGPADLSDWIGYPGPKSVPIPEYLFHCQFCGSAYTSNVSFVLHSIVIHLVTANDSDT